jgi:hypothetical protein
MNEATNNPFLWLIVPVLENRPLQSAGPGLYLFMLPGPI